jgi:uncharacterized membrane protein YhiD involved in acid resistance
MAKTDLIKMEMLILDNQDIEKARNVVRDLIITESNYDRVDSDDISTLRNALAVMRRITHRKDQEIKKMFNERNV